MSILGRKGTRRGEVRRLKSGGTGEVFEYEANGHEFRAEFDPRESGALCFMSLYAWDVPAGERIAPEAHDEVLDAIWSIAPDAGVRALIVRVDDAGCYAAMRWSYPSDHLLATLNSTHVEVLALRRTLRVAYREKPGSAASPVAILDRATAEWLYPEKKALTEYDWSPLRPKLSALSPKDLFLCDYEWRIEP